MPKFVLALALRIAMEADSEEEAYTLAEQYQDALYHQDFDRVNELHMFQGIQLSISAPQLQREMQTHAASGDRLLR